MIVQGWPVGARPALTSPPPCRATHPYTQELLAAARAPSVGAAPTIELSFIFGAPHDTTESLKDYHHVRGLAIQSLFEIIEQSIEGTVIVDRDANIVWMNERYANRLA